MNLCEHELRWLSAPGSEADELPTHWAWCSECGGVFCRTGWMPPNWPEDEDAPFALAARSGGVWRLGPRLVASAAAWVCRHESVRALAGRSTGEHWRWCFDCGALWQSPTLPAQAWQKASMIEIARDQRLRPCGIWHHPRCHGIGPAQPLRSSALVAPG